MRFADEWATFLPAGALEAIRTDIQLSYAQAGLVLVALSGGGLVGNAFIIAADYVSRRWLAAAGALAYGVSMIGFGLAESFLGLAVCAFLWGAASDAFIHGCEVALVDLAGEDLPRALGRVNAWAALGDLLGPLALAAAISAGLGWRFPFVAGGVLMLGYALWVGTQRFPAPRPPEHLQNPVAGVLAVISDRRVLLLAALGALFDLLDEPLLGFTIAYYERAHGLEPTTATALVLSAVGGSVVGYLMIDRVRFGGRTALVGSAAGLALALPLMVFAPWTPVLAAGGVVFGVTGAVFYTVLQATTLTLRPGQAGAVSAVVSMVGMAGIGFPALVGLASDAFGLAAGLGLYALVPAALLILTVAARRS